MGNAPGDPHRTRSREDRTRSREDRTRSREEQLREAKSLLFSGVATRSFAKELFHGRFADDLVMPYPTLRDPEETRIDRILGELRAFCDERLDPDEIDRKADIPRSVIDGLGELGVLGLTAPESFGGKDASQLAYCRILEELGGRCNSTALFTNAHHSIGMRGLLLFGTDEQKRRWLPDLVSGRKLAAFALTEVEAGSDAANVQTTAEPTEDASHFILNGEKRYITNGAIADVLTVMARTPVPNTGGTAITAFWVTPDLPGFRVVEPRMEKLGVRGTATAKLAFENVRVPRENILGPHGQGLKIALTVLDFGRTTFGACCTGAAKTCLRLATDHARSRVQFGRTLGEFELVQKKLAGMAAWIYAMEAMTTVTAGLIDRRHRGLAGDPPVDYMAETAILKVATTEALWTIVDDAFQIHGGAAYFTDMPLERLLRDARVNQIGEGANEVLISFIGLVGMRGPGEELRHVRGWSRRPWEAPGALARFLGWELARRVRSPSVPVRSPVLVPHARRLERLIRRFGLTVQRALFRHREEILERQLVQEPIARAAMELYASACVLSRREAELSGAGAGNPIDDVRSAAALLFLRGSADRIEQALRATYDPRHGEIVGLAERLLRS